MRWASRESSVCRNGPQGCGDGRGRGWEENPTAGLTREPQGSKSSGRDWSKLKSGTGSSSAGPYELPGAVRMALIQRLGDWAPACGAAVQERW
jgi:hypothetical protein